MEALVDDRPEGTTRSISLEAAKEELDCLLRDAVREHLVSDVPLGVWAVGRAGFLGDSALRGGSRRRGN